MALTDANPAFGPTEREPRMCSDEQGEFCSKRAKEPAQTRTLGCILGSDNMETDRTFEIVNLRKKSLGAKQILKLTSANVLSVTGIWP